MKSLPNEIDVTSAGDSRWHIQVRAAAGTTSHVVTIPEGYRDTLGVAGVAPERVIEESFRFLLEREPNTSILHVFSLSAIERYFPEYAREIQRRLKR